MAESAMARLMIESALRGAVVFDKLVSRYGSLDVGTLDRATAGTWMHDVLRWAESGNA